MVGQAILRGLARRSEIPDGVFSLLHGANDEVGMRLVRHPLTQAVAFTGSTRGGRALFDAAAARPHPIPVYAEMGSTNPVFVLPAALAERGSEIAKRFVQSVTLGVGQFCTKPGLLVTVNGPACDGFLATVAERIARVPAAPMLNDRICQSFRAGVDELMPMKGVEVVGKGAGEIPAAGSWALPLILRVDAGTFLATPRLAEEVFGPFSLVVVCDSVKTMEQVAYAPSAAILAAAKVHATAGDHADGFGLLRILERQAGRIVFNGFPPALKSAARPFTTAARIPRRRTATFHIHRHDRHPSLRAARFGYQDCPEDFLPAVLAPRQ